MLKDILNSLTPLPPGWTIDSESAERVVLALLAEKVIEVSIFDSEGKDSRKIWFDDPDAQKLYIDVIKNGEPMNAAAQAVEVAMGVKRGTAPLAGWHEAIEAMNAFKDARQTDTGCDPNIAASPITEKAKRPLPYYQGKRRF